LSIGFIGFIGFIDIIGCLLICCDMIGLMLHGAGKMTQAIIHDSSKQNAQISDNSSSDSLYDVDFLLWTEAIAAKLRARDFANLDLENLIEEIEGLGKSDKKELLNRLATLIEHLLKRVYVNMPECFNGWERTIREQRKQIKRELKFSPSLIRFWDGFFDEALVDALDEVRSEEGYRSINFPDTWQFNRDVEAILTVNFWE